MTPAQTIRRDDGSEVTSSEGRAVAAALAGLDLGKDLAVLKMDGVDLDPVEDGDARSLKPGHLALAVARMDELGVGADSRVIGSTGGSGVRAEVGSSRRSCNWTAA